MKQLTASEILFVSNFFSSNPRSLSVLKATLPFVSDKELKELIKTSRKNSEARINGLGSLSATTMLWCRRCAVTMASILENIFGQI